ncbi:MAG: penicillin-binding protein 2 [Bacteroidetes bacterium]|nr:penicillin-binding protein 2 [Bacteroidota bacterium]MCL5027126.1 penicillin-binding protein 2 [Chloroflexota bacterium]
MGLLLVQVFGFPGAASLASPGAERSRTAGASSPLSRPPATVRGAIYDATGQLLAADVTYESLYADPVRVNSPDRLASTLSPVLGSSESDLRTRLLARQREPVLVQSALSADQVEQVRRLARPELMVRTEARRGYPEGKLGGAVLGLVGRDGRGLTGLEAGYDAELSGRLGYGRNAYYRGADLVLTLDRFAQRIAEVELEKTVAAQRASGGAVVVMDPSTGAVLAMAASPAIDPKQIIDEGQVAMYRHPAVSVAYEPVSLIRIMTMAAALDTGAVTTDHTFLNKGTAAAGNGAAPSGGQDQPGPENMTQVVQRGSEIGVAYVANRLGADAFYQYMAKFGFGQATGIGMADENAGMVGTQANFGSQAFGRGILATPLQLAAGASAIANGGLLMQPYLVQEMHFGDAKIPFDPRLVRQVISPATARAVKEMMAATVQGPEATATQAALPPYVVAGIASAPGSASPSNESVSFIGIVPADKPRFTIVVKVDRPQTSFSGPEVAAPLFRAVAEQLLAYYRVPPSTTLAGVQQ